MPLGKGTNVNDQTLVDFFNYNHKIILIKLNIDFAIYLDATDLKIIFRELSISNIKYSKISNYLYFVST